MSPAPFTVRPQDLLRRAFDELGLALHYFVAGAMVASKGAIEFSDIGELMRMQEGVPIYGLQPILRQSGGWNKLNSDSEAGLRQQLQKFNESTRAHELSGLLLHIIKTARPKRDSVQLVPQWRCGKQRLFGDNASTAALSAVYLLYHSILLFSLRKVGA
jgi:hypothetical protein